MINRKILCKSGVPRSYTNQGEKSGGSKVRMETNGPTDTTESITFLANAGGN